MHQVHAITLDHGVERETLRWDLDGIVLVHDVYSVSAPFSRGTRSEASEARCSQGKGCIFGRGTRTRFGGGVRKKQKPAVRRAQLKRRSGARENGSETDTMNHATGEIFFAVSR